MWNRHPCKSCCWLIPLVLWAPVWSQACQEEGLPRAVVLDWFKQRVLEGLGLEGPPVPHEEPLAGTRAEAPPEHPASARVGRAAWEERRGPQQDASRVILFPSSESTCAHSSEGAPSFTYYFQPSAHSHDSAFTSGHFWFYSGEGAQTGNASAPLYILTAHQQLLQVAKEPEKRAEDGWSTYAVEHRILSSMAEGPFMLQVRCPTCACHADADKTPFLHLHARSRGADRARRSSFAWSPSALDLLQRPPQEKPDYNDCHREELNISFQELGWDNWIVHPKVFTFRYCHGNCSSWDRMTTILGIKQCCTPVPGTMKSLRFRTTSDGGYSFKYETLPNIIAEDCTCI
ncbi:inhibin alpha chain [Megalops cyprinoides]|uniref:inhibin alpha chain n=1 Tax=Megalops cyprinoides TaxID=118141 RepID=UPI001864D25A|nr:inhibin alpha chain [Megalops cyprinoides]